MTGDELDAVEAIVKDGLLLRPGLALALIAEARKVQAIAALHTPYDDDDVDVDPYCESCTEDLPCPTIRIILGES